MTRTATPHHPLGSVRILDLGAAGVELVTVLAYLPGDRHEVELPSSTLIVHARHLEAPWEDR